jgi:hypothetical protein
MSVLHRQLIEQTCKENKVALDLRPLTQEQIQSITIPILLEVIANFKNKDEPSNEVEHEYSYI